MTTENDESLGPTNHYDSQMRMRLAHLFRFPIPPPEYKDRAPTLQEMQEMTEEAGLLLVESFRDGALYKYLVEISPWVRTKMPRLAHFFSSLENHRGLVRLFCDQVKYVLRKGGQGISSHPLLPAHYACIYCRGQLQKSNGRYVCTACGHGYAIRGEIPDFLPDQLSEGTEESLGPPVGNGEEYDPSKIAGYLFPRVNRIVRAFYSGAYLVLAVLATLFVKRNRRPLSHLLSQEDPYQRYLKIS